MQGWSPDFISPLTQQAVAAGMVDEVVPVAGEEALRLARELARKEGIFVGISAGATLAAALQVARRAPAGSHVVCMLPDTGERYQSTPLFEGIADEMNEEELALSRSTPGYRFDAPAPVAQPPAMARLDTTQQAASDVEAERRLDACLAQAPVVMFSLAWCEFCWAARKLFERLGVDVLSVDLDSPACQADDMGVRLRPVLARRTGASTIPQIFIGGKPLGGCGELFEAWADGSLGERLAACGVAYDGEARIDPDLLLPAWLHPRSTTA